jgi:hypothetical protein
MIVWRGWGIAVALIWGIFVFGLSALLPPGPLDDRGRQGMNMLAVGIGSLISAAATFGLAKYLESQDREGDSFWFIPVRFWPFLMGAVGVVTTIMSFVNK